MEQKSSTDGVKSIAQCVGEWDFDISEDSSSCDLNPKKEIQHMEEKERERERASIIPNGSKAHCKNAHGFRAESTLETVDNKMQMGDETSGWTGT